MTWTQINEKLSYLLPLSFFFSSHNSPLVSVKNIPRCSLATPLYEVYQWKTWETDFAPSLKVLFKVQVAKLLQRIEANVSDTDDMQRRGKSRATLSLQLKVTKNMRLTKLSIATPALKLQQPPQKTALWSNTAVWTLACTAGLFCFLSISADWQKIWLMSLGTWPRRCLVITL